MLGLIPQRAVNLYRIIHLESDPLVTTLTSGRYSGTRIRAHASRLITSEHFGRWLGTVFGDSVCPMPTSGRGVVCFAGPEDYLEPPA
jgi:hypothetical protein